MKQFATRIITATLAIMIVTTVFGSVAQASQIKKAVRFIEGVMIGFVSHETGHQVMAMSEGESLKWTTGGGNLGWSPSSDSVLKKETAYWGPIHANVPVAWGWRKIYNSETMRFEQKYVVIQSRYRDMLSTPEYIKKREKAILMGGFLMQVTSSEILLHKKDLHKDPLKKGWLFFNVANSILYVGSEGFGSSGDGDISDLEKHAGATREKTSEILIAHAIFTAWRYYHPEKTDLIPEVKFDPRNSGGVKIEWERKF